jgi:hypothetical protein
MSRTFSLARLMLGITLLCVMCAVAVNFPIAAILVAYLVVQLLPVVFVWFVLTRYSPHRGGLAFTCLVGGLLGLIPVSPFAAGAVLDDLDLIDDFWRGPLAFAILAFGAAVGALLLSWALLLCDVYLKWYRNNSISK